MDWTNKSSMFQNREKRPRLDELVDIHKFASGEFYTLRAVGPPNVYSEHWVKFNTKTNKTVSIRLLCRSSFKKKTGEPEDCPYCTLLEDRSRPVALQNFIVRKHQEAEPRKTVPPSGSEATSVKLWDGKSLGHIKRKTSKAWTPVRVGRLPSSLARLIMDISALNTAVDKKTGEIRSYGPDHPRYGFDIVVKWQENEAPASQYFVQKESRTPLTETEKGYLLYDLACEKPETLEEATANARRIAKGLIRNIDGKDVVGLDLPGDAKTSTKDPFADYADIAGEPKGDSDLSVVRKKPSNATEPKPKVKKKTRSDDDDDGGDEEVTRKKKKKIILPPPPAKKKKKAAAAPVKKKKTKKIAFVPPKKKTSRNSINF